jgi:two-component system, OmpR family, sensor kinase
MSELRHRLAAVPLRDQLVAVLLVLTLAALVVTGGFAVALLRGELTRKVDTQILATGAALLRDPQNPARSPAQRGLPTATYGAVVLDTGEVVGIGRRVGTAAPDLSEITPAVTAEQAGRPFTVRADDRATAGGAGRAGRWRVVAIRVDSLDVGPGTLVVGQSLADVQDTVVRMAIVLLLVGLATLAAIGAVGRSVVRRSLRPLREVEDVAGAIATGDLTQRVPEHPPATEVGRLATSLNAMLTQIEQAFAVRAASEERMRRFVSDASHELRTPLAAVRGYAELYRQGAVSQPDDVSSAMSRIESEATRMGDLVEDLLTLARLDEQRPERRVPVDLTVLAADAVQDARALAPDRAVTLTGRGGPLGPTMVRGDEARLRQVVGNLLANALRHTPTGSPVQIAVGVDQEDGTGHGVVEVRDHGPGVPAEQVRSVFERFFRADASRQRASGGTGLGLAIVAAIVAAHGGQVAVSRTPGGGATFAVRLPTALTGNVQD